MKHKILSSIALFILLISSCTKKENIEAPLNTALTAQFESEQAYISENIGEHFIQLELSNISPKKEVVVIKITDETAKYGDHFSTIPQAVQDKLSIEFPPGTRQKTIAIKIKDNTTKDDPKAFSLEIIRVGNSVTPIGKTSIRLHIVDDESKSTIAFKNLSTSILENATEGKEIELKLTSETESDGYVEIRPVSTNAIYGVDFRSLPAMQNGKIVLPIRKSATSAFFKIIPIDNNRVENEKRIEFQIIHSTRDILIGSPASHQVFLVEDDQPLQNKIRVNDIRNSLRGMELFFPVPTRIEGVVISTKENFRGNVVHIQDEMGGIALQLNSTHTFTVGDILTVNLEGARVKEELGVLTASEIGLSSIEKIGWEMLIATTKRLKELYTLPRQSIHFGKLIHIPNIRFTEANGTLTMQGDRVISDGNRTAIVRTEQFAQFRNMVVPKGLVSVTGIAVFYQGKYIIYPASASSIR